MQQTITYNNLLDSTSGNPILSINRKWTDWFDRFLPMKAEFFGKNRKL